MAVTVGVLAYDIADTRRRTRLHKLLEGYGMAVQESVFVLELTPSQWATLERKVLALTDAAEDDVRVWPLCAACRPRARAWRGPPKAGLGAVAIV